MDIEGNEGIERKYKGFFVNSQEMSDFMKKAILNDDLFACELTDKGIVIYRTIYFYFLSGDKLYMLPFYTLN